MNKKRILKLSIICICILIISILLFLGLKYNKINILEKGIFADTNQDVIDGMTFFVYDNTEEKLKTLVRISRENGMDTVEYINENNENIILNCNGKQRVSIDINAELNKEYSFLVTSAGNTVTEKFRIDETYMKDFLDGIMDIKEITNEKGEMNTGIEFFYKEDGKRNYYRITETGSWIECTSLGLTQIDISGDGYELSNINFEEVPLVKVYTKQVDSLGNTLIKQREVAINKAKLDVFNDMRVKGISLDDYGFTASWSNVEEKNFAIGNFQAGHHTDNANWSGTFTWNNPKTYGAKQIYVDFYHYARKTQGSASNASSRIIVNYTDGTQETKNNVVTTGTSNSPPEVHCPLMLDLETDKEIRNIQFYLYGYDANYSSSYTRLTNIVLKGIPLPIIEDEE